MPTEEERRKMLGLMVEISINLCMEHHYYIYDGKVKKQELGAGIGLRLSEALGIGETGLETKNAQKMM